MKTLTAITTKQGLVDLFPIVPASECLPKWVAATKFSYEKSKECPVAHSPSNSAPTIKGCHGVMNVLNRGFLIPAWEDMSIVVYPDRAVSFVGAGSGNIGMTRHDDRQKPSSFKDKIIVKLHSPWFFYCDSTEFMFLPATYHNNLGGVSCLHALVDFENMPSTNVFLAFDPADEPYEVFIRAGTPLAHVVPMTANDVVVVNVYDPDHKPLASRSFFFLRPYQRLKKLLGRTQ